jgi:long-chain acyl-CoA synthetase
VAVLQYTGGTTGVSKGAVLLHRNLVANVLQNEIWAMPLMSKIPAGEQPTSVCALPLYHIFAFTYCMMLSMRMGGKLILIPNPRDLPAMFKELSKHRIHVMPAVNTLFNGMANHPDFKTVDWSHLKASTGGGTAVQSAVAKLWLEKTGSPILEGYGLSETSPTASGNPATATEYSGSIGVPLPNTWMKLLDDDGNEVEPGQPGEIAIKGPQVMAGYWQRPDETAKVMTPDGYFKSGDIGTMDERGFFRSSTARRTWCWSAASTCSRPSSKTSSRSSRRAWNAPASVCRRQDRRGGQAGHRQEGSDLTEADVRAYCRENLTGYKQPKIIEFRTELPKTPVGKILRRELRDK